MTTPSGRTPIRIARGLKADLLASINDLLEGEICWAEDENRLYVVEGRGAAAALSAASGGGGSGTGSGLFPGNGVSANPAQEILTIDTGSF